MVNAINESLELSESILGEILGLYRDIRELSDEGILYCSSDRSGKLFLKLNSLITLDLGSDVTCTLLNKQKLETVFVHMDRFRNLYTVRLETEYANEILASQSPWDVLEEFPFYKNYLGLVRTEYEGFGLKAGDRVFFHRKQTSSFNTYCFFQISWVKGTGIEQDPERAKISMKALDKLGLSEDITIIHGSHLSLNPIDFIDPDTGAKALMIAAQAEPKREILGHLLKVIPAGFMSSYRIYEKGLMKLVNRDFLFDLPEGYGEHKSIRPEPPAYNTVVFLDEKGNCSGSPE